MVPTEARDLARNLLAWEVSMVGPSETREAATNRVYEKLRLHLCELAGIDAFLSLASRALAQAKSESSELWAVHVAEDGALVGLGESEIQLHSEDHLPGDGGIALIARLFGLLLIFLGEATTLNLVQKVWPDVALYEGNSGREKQSRVHQIK